jgi:hypothetical protein
LCSASSKDVRVETTLVETLHWLGLSSKRNLILFLPLHWSRQKELSGKSSKSLGESPEFWITNLEELR